MNDTARIRLGVFGGSFDPVHYGHLLLAETCREQCGLDAVWFVPALVPPHKQQRELSGANQRLEMLQLAVAGHESFVVSDLEIRRGGVSYTVDTLGAVQREQPRARLFLLMGADSLCDLPTWHAAAEVCQLAIPVVVRRRHTPEPDLSVLARMVSESRLEEIRRHQAEMPVIEFSSSAIRQAVAAGRSIRYQTPRAVEKYIQSNGLYVAKDDD
jgi:nicotinate-nucleotide adenylyltransferase